MIRYLIAAVLLCLSVVASAQNVTGRIDLSWTLPVTGCTQGVTPCDNVQLSGDSALTAINVYISTSPIPADTPMAPTLALTGDTSDATHTMQVTNGTTLYARVRAINAAGASGFSNEVSQLITLPVQPGVPSNVTITLTFE